MPVYIKAPVSNPHKKRSGQLKVHFTDFTYTADSFQGEKKQKKKQKKKKTFSINLMLYLSSAIVRIATKLGTM